MPESELIKNRCLDCGAYFATHAHDIRRDGELRDTCPHCGSRNTSEWTGSSRATMTPVETDVKQDAGSRQEGGKHYKEMGVEPWDVIDTWPIEQQIGYHRGNALKYIMRMGSKDEHVQEVRKAGHYIAKLIEVLEKRDD